MNIRQTETPFYIYLGGGVVFLFLAILLKPFTVINAGERGVVMHFGEVQEQILNEGFHPIFPIYTNIKKMSVKVRKVDVATKVGTKDLQNLDFKTSVNWHIEANRVNQIYQQVGDEAQIREIIIIPAISEVLKASTPQRTAEEILKQRSDLKQEIERALKPRLAKYGLLLDDVSITKIGIVSPSVPIDLVWHLHLIYTHSYWHKFCDGVLGKPVHHSPSLGGKIEKKKYDRLYEQTLATYQVYFGTPPADIWLNHSDWNRNQRYWVMPNPLYWLKQITSLS